MDVNIIGNSAVSAVQLTPAVTPAVTTSAQRPSPTPAPVPIDQATGGHAGSLGGSASPTLEQVTQAVNNINASLNAKGSPDAVQFAVDPSSKHIVVQMLDPGTGEVIRQIPSEEIIQMGMALGQKLGQVINQQA